MLCWLFAITNTVVLRFISHGRCVHGVPDSFLDKDNLSRLIFHDEDPPLFKFCSMAIMTYSLWQTQHMCLSYKVYLSPVSLRSGNHYTDRVTLRP